MEWVKNLDSSDWISVINALATLVLSFFVYKSTNKASEAAVKTVQLTEQTLILNQSMVTDKEEEKRMYRNSLKYQYVKVLMKRSDDILKAITHSDGMKIHKNLTNLEYKHYISPENLALCFKDYEVKQIADAWYSFEIYLEKYYKVTYSHDELNVLASHAGTSIENFTIINDLMTVLQKEINH
ncbi:hypothetical protein MHB84_22980 [Paenibacillus sp. FSL F4-0087]|uniref:hypothetical protein n=1 Tax=Paenibacillus sp. FSL F4-0087 TaxID=2921368 RepID=UPI00096D9FAE|nr:hypothetical protein BK122_27500 [Paenibacillus pabuli]